MKKETYKLTVDGEEKEYVLHNLSWDDFPKLMHITSKLNIKKGEEDDLMSKLDEGTVSKIMELEFKMFKKSYPELSDSVVKDIVLQNIFPLLEPLIALNIGK